MFADALVPVGTLWINAIRMTAVRRQKLDQSRSRGVRCSCCWSGRYCRADVSGVVNLAAAHKLFDLAA